VALISVTISGNAAPLRNELDKAEGLFGKFGGAVTKIAAASAAAFAGLAAGLAVATKAAAEDQKSFEQLRIAIQNTTNATDAMVQAIDDQILKMSLAVGVADDQLRPAFGNLIRATGDAAKAQDLLSTALDISTATGKPLEAVSIALAKAANGQVTALTRLGIPLDENAVKAKDFDAILGQLNETFGGAAAANAETFSGKMDRVKVVFGEIVETVGGAVLPIVDKLATFFLEKIIPAFEYVSNTVGPQLSEVFGTIAAFIQEKVVPVIEEYLVPAIEKFAGIFLDYIVPTIKTIAIPIFEGLGRIFDVIVQKVRDNRDTFSRLIQTMQIVFGFVRDKLAPVIALGLSNAFKVAAFAIGVLIDIGSKFADVFGAIVRVVAKIAGQIIDIMAGLVNTVIDAVNVMIRGFMRLPSILRFGISIDEIPKVNLSKSLTSGGGISGPSLADIRNEREGNLPSITGGTFTGGAGMAGIVEDVATGGGGGGGSRGGGGTTAVTVNVNTPLATKAEIGDAVIQAIRASNAIGGYLPFVASPF
jgi:hypothetical protein